MFRRAFRHTIWAEDALPAEDQYKAYRRVWMPVVDLLYIGGGLGLVQTPETPALSEVLRGAVAGYGAALALVSLVTLVGAVFPRLWGVEVAGKVGILFLMAALLAACLLTGRPFGGALAAIASVPILFRLSVLGAERRQRKEHGSGGL